MKALFFFLTNKESAAGFKYDLMSTFGIHYRNLTLDERATFAYGLRSGSSRALEGRNEDLAYGNLERLLLVNTNAILSIGYGLNIFKGDEPPFVPLPSQVEEEQKKKAEYHEKEEMNLELINRLQEMYANGENSSIEEFFSIDNQQVMD